MKISSKLVILTLAGCGTLLATRDGLRGVLIGALVLGIDLGLWYYLENTNSKKRWWCD